MTSKPEISVTVDPLLDEHTRDHLLAIWVDVTNAGGAVGFVPPVSKEDVENVATEAFDRALRGADHLVVAYENDLPIGFCFLEQRPGPLFRHWAFIKRLQLEPSLQGKGYGAAILERLHAIALEMGLEQLHLTVRGGTGIERFYEHHGYEVFARIPGVIRIAPDDTRDELYLIKVLAEERS